LRSQSKVCSAEHAAKHEFAHEFGQIHHAAKTIDAIADQSGHHVPLAKLAIHAEAQRLATTDQSVNHALHVKSVRPDQTCHPLIQPL
jgi:hypothetical protein